MFILIFQVLRNEKVALINCLLDCLLNFYVNYSLGKNLLASGRKQRNMTPATAQYV